MPLQTGDLAEIVQEGDAKGGNEGSEWAWLKAKRGNLLNAQRGAIVDGYELLAGERKLVQVAPTFAHVGAEHCFFF